MVRTGLAGLLFVFLIPIVAAANLSSWGLRTALDSSTFSTTVGRGLDAPATERLVADALADGIVDRIQTEPGRLDLPRRLLAVQLGLPAEADDGTIRSVLRDRLHGSLQDPAVERVRNEVIVTVHRYVLGVAQGQGGLVVIRGKDVVLDTPRILDRIEESADPQLATLIGFAPPAVSAPIVVAQVKELEPIGRVLRAMKTLELLLPLLAVTAALLVLLLAHRRARATRIVAINVAIAGLLSLAAAWAAGLYVSAVPDAPVARQLTRDVYDAFLRVLVTQTLILVTASVALAIVARLAEVRGRRRATARMLGPR